MGIVRSMTEVVIETLWRTRSEQCELVVRGMYGARLRLWVNGRLLVDEDVFDRATAVKRAFELRSDWSRHAD